MTRRIRTGARLLRIGFLLSLATAFGAGPKPEPSPAPNGAPLTFEKHVRPILKAYCFQCHGDEEKPKGELDLRLVRAMVRGGLTGEAIVPGHHEESYLWERLDADEMPPGEKKLSDADKATIAAWIDQGAKTDRPEPESLPPGAVLTEDDLGFWSFQPIRRPDVPSVRHQAQVRTPIDAFLLQKLEAEGLAFAPEADPRTLLRRLALDLTGLPPTPEQTDAFLDDHAADPHAAYDRAVEQFLASPHYGERWARHWLDVAGYADSDGVTAKDAERPYAYKYRDYLIRALNADRPWDELIREQLAGDEMLTPPYQDLTPEQADKLIATGFLRMAPDGTSDGSLDATIARNDVVAETVKIVSTSLLGLTVGCAQCHAHRYDPISHTDYYRFRALFEPGLDPAHWRLPQARLISLWGEAERGRAAEVDAEVKAINKERNEQLEALVKTVFERELSEVPEDVREKVREAWATPASKRSDEQKKLLKDHPKTNVTVGNVSLHDAKAFRAITEPIAKRIAAAQAKRPPDDMVQAFTEVPGTVPTTRLFSRGDPNQPRQPVAPGELTVLERTVGTADIPEDDPALPTTGRRLAYARHLTSGQHPLVARVLVNRFWMHHFGRGLVATPADFGRLGERPSHPELLDWLADEFMRAGWSLKHLHRLILTSTAFRQSSRAEPAVAAVDPDNRLLGRMPVRRLEAEAVRDSVLFVSGQLNEGLLGPPVPVAPDETGQVILGNDNRDSAGRPVGKRAGIGSAEFRRSLYIQMRRSLPFGVLEVFDEPAMTPNCDRRASSTVAPQSLMLMNNDTIVRAAEAFAERLEREAGPEPANQVRRAWRLAVGRDPTARQVETALAFLDRQRDDLTAAKNPNPARAALASFGQALLCSNAFLYID